MKKILGKDAKVLRQKAVEVPLEKIGTPYLNKIINEMKEALSSQDDGVAIAAPQIGYSLRIFVISGKVSDIQNGSKKALLTQKDGTEIDYKPDLVFINPVIKKVSKTRNMVEEGCLSVRYLYGKVSRARQATVEAYDENGKKFERGGSGLMAQIFQHETDHLDGVLFIDKAKQLEDLPPPEIKNKNE